VQYAFPSFAGVIKLIPNIVIFPVAYKADGATDAREGESSSNRKMEPDSAWLFGNTAPALLMTSFKAYFPNTVVIRIEILNVELSKRTQDTLALPSVALHVAAESCAVVIKLAPVTVIVPLM
jgi:hypothetical protein